MQYFGWWTFQCCLVEVGLSIQVCYKSRKKGEKSLQEGVIFAMNEYNGRSAFINIPELDSLALSEEFWEFSSSFLSRALISISHLRFSHIKMNTAKVRRAMIRLTIAVPPAPALALFSFSAV